MMGGQASGCGGMAAGWEKVGACAEVRVPLAGLRQGHACAAWAPGSGAAAARPVPVAPLSVGEEAGCRPRPCRLGTALQEALVAGCFGAGLGQQSSLSGSV